MRYAQAIIVVLVAALCFVASCDKKPAQSAADFVFINRGEVGTLDPNRMSWLQDIRIGYALWEGLYQLDPQTLEPIPGAAEKIDVNPEKTIWTFHLRKDGKWSNGQPVTTADFLFAWKRMLMESGDYTYLLHYIKGAKEFEEACAKDARADFSGVGIEVIDPLTMRVTLNHPVAFFPDICSFAPMFPLNEKSLEPFKRIDEKTGRVSYDEKWTRPPNLVGNGPYKLTQWELKRVLRLEASEFYWDRASVKSKVIEQLSSDDPMNAFLRYEAGGVDWQAEITGNIAADLLAKGRKDLKVFPGFGTYFYSINVQPQLSGGRKNPMADVRVRKALSMSIDKNQIVKNITRLGEPPAVQYIPPGVFGGYQSPKGLDFDVSAAKKLLADAGFPDGANWPRVTLLYNTEGQHTEVAQFVARQWKENLNVSVELEGVEIKTFRERLHNKDYDIARASWIGDYNDPSTFTDKYFSYSLNNDSGWMNKQFDTLAGQANREPDSAKRLQLFQQAEQLLLDEAPIIPLYHYVNAYLIRDGVSGIALHPRNMVSMKSVQRGK